MMNKEACSISPRSKNSDALAQRGSVIERNMGPVSCPLPVTLAAESRANIELSGCTFGHPIAPSWRSRR